MAWLRLDDRFTKHPKVLKLKRADRWTWLEILEYCAAYQTGGHIPDAIADVIPHATPAIVKQLVDARLLDVEDGGYHVHDWLEYNPPRVDADDLEQRVAHTLAEYPEASANEVHRIVGGRKQAVLDLVKRFRNSSLLVPERFPPSVPGTGWEPVTRAGARARPVPSPTQSSIPSSSVDRDAIRQALDDDDLANAIERTQPTPEQRQRAHLALADESDRLRAALNAALEHAGKVAPYVDRILTNGTWPEAKTAARAREPSPYPTGPCPDCGESYGHGHLETCPRMPAQASDPEPAAARPIPGPPPELLATVGIHPDDPEPAAHRTEDAA